MLAWHLIGKRSHGPSQAISAAAAPTRTFWRPRSMSAFCQPLRRLALWRRARRTAAGMACRRVGPRGPVASACLGARQGPGPSHIRQRRGLAWHGACGAVALDHCTWTRSRPRCLGSDWVARCSVRTRSCRSCMAGLSAARSRERGTRRSLCRRGNWRRRGRQRVQRTRSCSLRGGALPGCSSLRHVRSGDSCTRCRPETWKSSNAAISLPHASAPK